MLFHEALHLVFVTFSRQVLQQGRLTNYLADCGVFEPVDDRRTICLTIAMERASMHASRIRLTKSSLMLSSPR